MNKKHKSTSPSAVQVKNQRKTVGIEEKLDEISWLEKGEWIVDMCHNVWFDDISVHSIGDIADRITESAKSVIPVLCNKTATVLSDWTVP